LCHSVETSELVDGQTLSLTLSAVVAITSRGRHRSQLLHNLGAIGAPRTSDGSPLGGADALSARPFVRLLALTGTGVAVWWTDCSVSLSRDVRAGRGVCIVASSLESNHTHTHHITRVAITSRGRRRRQLLRDLGAIVATRTSDGSPLGGADALSAKPFVRLLALTGTGVAVWWTDRSVSLSRDVRAGRGVHIVPSSLEGNHTQTHHITWVAITSRGRRRRQLLCDLGAIVATRTCDGSLLGGADALSAKPFVRLLLACVCVRC